MLCTRLCLFVVLSISAALNAQETMKDSIGTENNNQYKDYTAVKISMLLPNSTGNNFATEALDFKYGYNLDLAYYFPFDMMIGIKYQFMRAVPSNISLIGNYDRSNINTYALNLGYRIKLNKRFDVEPVFSIGYTTYNNKKDFSENISDRIKFRDQATTLIFSASINYGISQKISFFVQPDYRLDFMNIETANEIQDFFDNAAFFNLQAGVRFNFE